MKRVTDILIVCLVAIPAVLVGLILSFLIRMKLGSPVIFSQNRPGLDGGIFKMIKFRSMSDEMDADGELLPDKDRLPSFGKCLRNTSLDELPELWNVLKGDMSLVGPRPLLEEYLPLYDERQSHRHDVRPGITGWAQVNGRNAVDWSERLEMDVWYVENHNFWLDIKIMWMTFFTVFYRKGVSAEGHATMPKFRGSDD